MIKYYIDLNSLDIFTKKIIQLKNPKNSIAFTKDKETKIIFFCKRRGSIESLENDGIQIPKDLDRESLSKSYNVPDSLLDLANRGEKGFLALKIVEIIGEDEVNNLDPETIYFITNLLNQLNLKEFRNSWFCSTFKNISIVKLRMSKKF